MKNFFKKLLLFLSVASVVAVALHLKKREDQEPIHFKKRHVNTLQNNSFHCHNIKNCRTRHVVMRDWGLKNKKLMTFGALAVMATMVISQSLLKPYYPWLRTSLLDIKQEPFTGTLTPVAQVPRWTSLSEEEYRMSFDDIPKSKLMALPKYDPVAIKKGYTSKWGENNDERNAYITYSVLHMGDYRLEGNHGNGSHMGVDIKLPMRTPIRAIANGEIYAVGHSDTGFGNVVTIVHRNIPISKDSNKTQTLYSTYAHMDETMAVKGNKIKKGEQIGVSGNSGNATAPHLHFQITKEDAPFQPYWPFTWKDLDKNHTTYFEAINDGLNKNNGFTYSVDPMNLVSEYKNYENANLVVSAEPEVETHAQVTTSEKTENEENPFARQYIEKVAKVDEEGAKADKEKTEVTTETSEKTKETTEAPEKRSVIVRKLGNEKGLIIETDKTFIPGKSEQVTIRLEDINLVATNGIQLDSTLRQLAQIQPSYLKEKNFIDGVAKVVVTTDSNSSFKLIASGDFGEIKSDSLRAYVFTDIPRTHKYGDAISYLKDNHIIEGYSDGTFRPENTINRAEAIKILLEGNTIKSDRNPNPFNDVVSQSWYENYVTTAAKLGIIKGYEDGSFQPNRSISRAEFLKVATETAKINLPEDGDIYNDVQPTAWYYKYFLFAKKHFLFETSNGNVDPGKEITRGEAAYIMYKIAEM